jgi:hypothetical protein
VEQRDDAADEGATDEGFYLLQCDGLNNDGVMEESFMMLLANRKTVQAEIDAIRDYVTAYLGGHFTPQVHLVAFHQQTAGCIIKYPSIWSIPSLLNQIKNRPTKMGAKAAKPLQRNTTIALQRQVSQDSVFSPIMRTMSTVMSAGLAALKEGSEPFDKVFLPIRIALQDIFLEQLNGSRLASSVKIRFNLLKYYNIEHLLKAVILGTEGEKYEYNRAFPEDDVDGLRVCRMPAPTYGADPALQPNEFPDNVSCMANDLLNYGGTDEEFYEDFLQRCASTNLSTCDGASHWTSLVFGDIDYDKILVDAADQTHLFGLQNIGVGHSLSDIAKLECETLLKCPCIYEEEYANMLKMLTFLSNVQDLGAELPVYIPNVTDGGGAFADLPPRLRLLWHTVRLLRNFARRYCVEERDPQYYSMALAAHSLRVLGSITEERRSKGPCGDGEPSRSHDAWDVNAKLARANVVLHINRVNDDLKQLSLIGNGEMSPRSLGPALSEGELLDESEGEGGVMLTRDFVTEGKRYLYDCMTASYAIRDPLMNTKIPIEGMIPMVSMAGRNPHYKPRGQAASLSRDAVMASSGAGGSSDVDTADLAARARRNSADDGTAEMDEEQPAGAVYIQPGKNDDDEYYPVEDSDDDEPIHRRRSIIPARKNKGAKVEVHNGMPDTIREQVEGVLNGVDVTNFSIIALLGVSGSGKTATLHKLQYCCAREQAFELAQAESQEEADRKQQRDHWIAQVLLMDCSIHRLYY